ncbi:MAG: HD-GYP domain-containing protein [Spirochaetaceae bacterium]|jgi:HD-GYP domain-containing protein (c-di-GMP phosphodiesterase class II)|nr:HD-GYP domain-containing protein [Spirochaetaceae bacterium]
MAKYKCRDIPEGSYFSGAVYADNGFIIASPEIPVDENIKKLLLRWEFREMSAEGYLLDGPPMDLLSFLEEADADDSDPPNDDERIIRAAEFYTFLSKFTEKLLDKISSSLSAGQDNGGQPPGLVRDDAGISYQELADKMREFCRIILREGRYLLRIMQYKGTPGEGTDGREPDRIAPPSTKNDYQVSHTVKSVILSVVMGGYLKFNDTQLVELGVAALIHESGMLHIPPDTYLTDKPLTREERRAILSHPILGFNMLQSLNFPQNIRLAVLEHHERENGSGYPQRLTGPKIGLYAKIIAVACSFEAITAARPYKDARDGHLGILDLLKNEGGRYDDMALRALIYSLSIYPIGSYVLLSDGRKAQVVDASPNEPRYPIVRILGESDDAPVKTSPAGLRIVRLAPEKGEA